MKVLIGLQARSGSKRFPRKIYENIGPKSLIQWVYDACKKGQELLSSKNISSQVKILIPHDDHELSQFCGTNLLSYLAPICDEQDLIKRFLLGAREVEADAVIRITADCWQTDPGLVADIAQILVKEKADYASNTIHRSFMEGLDVQGCSLRALEWFDQNQTENREHPFIHFDANEIIRKKFEADGMKYMELLNKKSIWCVRTSIDTQDDIDFARRLYDQEQATRRLVAGKNEKLPSPRGDGNKLETTQSVY